MQEPAKNQAGLNSVIEDGNRALRVPSTLCDLHILTGRLQLYRDFDQRIGEQNQKNKIENFTFFAKLIPFRYPALVVAELFAPRSG